MINKKILNYLEKNIGKYRIIELEQDASLRRYFRINSQNKNYIFMDSSKDSKQFDLLLEVNKVIKNTNISIPQIFNYDLNNKFMILEDFGINRFDKLIHIPKYTEKLLKYAVDSLVVIKNTIKYNNKFNIITFDYNLFKNEISEFVEFYYPFIFNKKMPISYKKDFYNIWKKKFKESNFSFDSFVHKDFFCNNLFYLSSRNKYLKCGIIDYQDAMWGDEALDLVSLLEDSRRFINHDSSKDLINYFLKNTNQYKIKNSFYKRYNFLGAARQTRILGRWVKLLKNYNKNQYLKYLDITWKRLENNLKHNSLKEIYEFYNEIIPIKKRKYEN